MGQPSFLPCHSSLSFQIEIYKLDRTQSSFLQLQVYIKKWSKKQNNSYKVLSPHQRNVFNLLRVNRADYTNHWAFAQWAGLTFSLEMRLVCLDKKMLNEFQDGPQLTLCATWPRRPAGTTIAFQFRTSKRFSYRFYVQNWNVIVVTSWPARPSCTQNQLRTILKWASFS